MSRRTSSKKWSAQIRIDGKHQYIGNYDDEKEAAVDYARAVFKYKTCKYKRGEVFLTLSNSQGIYFNQTTKKWIAVVTIDGMKKCIGEYCDTASEAAAGHHIYMRGSTERGQCLLGRK